MTDESDEDVRSVDDETSSGEKNEQNTRGDHWPIEL